MHILSVQVCRNHLLLPSRNVGEDTEALSRSLSPCDIARLQTSTVATERGAILGRVWHLSRFTAIDASNCSGQVVLVHHCVGWVKWVRATLRLSLHLGDI